MSAFLNLVSFGLRQVVGEPAEMVVKVLEQRFTDHSQTLPRALATANDRAWQTIGVALAGDGLLEKIKVRLASGEEQALAQQVRLFLASTPGPFRKAPEPFRKQCLAELKRARQAGRLSVRNLSSSEVAQKTATFERYADPKGLVIGAEQVVGQIADGLAPEFPELASLLRQPTPGGPPLLVVAFAYFFRREVETDDQLSRGLFFDGLRQLSAAQEQAFADIGAALATFGQQFDQVLEQLDRIETVVVETHAAAAATHGAVLDMQAELQRLGGLNLASGAEVHRLLVEVLNRVGQIGMQKGEVKPHHSLSIRGQHEREAVEQLLARFRQLPKEQQQRVPALLNGLGKLQIGSGEFGGARKTFLEVAASVSEAAAQAEAHFNAYRAALEEKKWDNALVAIHQAAALDSQRFALFPMQRYEPKRILGAGGFGTAFLCHDRFFNAEVVVKTLHDAALERGTDKVFREAQVLGQLHHPAIIGVRDCSYADLTRMVRPYIVMNYFPGGSLESFIHQRGTLSPEELLNVAQQIAHGMRAAHQRGILHRDLKPANLLVRKEGKNWLVRIIDFGLALRQQMIDTSMAAHSTGHSILADSVAGTLKYAPPEQMGELRGVKPGPYSDVYAFGKTCFFALFRTAEPRSRQLSLLPKDLAEMLEKCVEQELEHRHPSFDPVLRVFESLQQLHAGESPSQRQEVQAELPAKQERTSPGREDGPASFRTEQDPRQRKSKDAERSRPDRTPLQQEGEVKLAELVRDALERTQGKPTQEDTAAANELCRRHHLALQQAKQIVGEARKAWQKPRSEKIQPRQREMAPQKATDSSSGQGDSVVVVTKCPGCQKIVEVSKGQFVQCPICCCSFDRASAAALQSPDATIPQSAAPSQDKPEWRDKFSHSYLPTSKLANTLPGSPLGSAPQPSTAAMTTARTVPSPAPVPAAPAYDVELPMCFYLGREYDIAAKRVLDQPVMFDAKDLTSHGVVVGQTGSGKTGLCISLLEEAAIDGIPSIIIDPKGELTNLLLQFPDLAPKDFLEWINPQEAEQKKMTPEKYAEELAERWTKGLEGSLQSPLRIRLLKESAEWRIYTPGSEAGLTLSILKTFAAPEDNILREQLNQRIDATATALLGLTGIVADPVQSREHILIAQLLLNAWSRGKSMDLPELIAQIQAPPLSKVGAINIAAFFPEKARLKLAIALNNILVAPSFSAWIHGEQLDVSQMLYTPEGKPRQVIFYIAHLEESQRMFFITLLLEEVLHWMRKQPRTSMLRALLCFDEVQSYLPAHSTNPPTKLPLKTMLEEAGAFGVGLLLASKSSVEIDYEALNKVGSWFIGELPSDDRARVIERLDETAGDQRGPRSHGNLEQLIAGLGSRVFLLDDVHRSKWVTFQTRQTLSLFCGPMSREKVGKLMRPVKEELCHSDFPGGSNHSREAEKVFPFGLHPMAAGANVAKVRQKAAPKVAEAVPQFYLPLKSPARPADATGLIYRPRVLAVAEVIFQDRKANLYHPKKYRLLTEAPAEGQTPAWHSSERIDIATSGLAVDPAYWEEVPTSIQSAKSLKGLEKSLIEYLYDDAKLVLYENKKLELTSNPGEDRMAFLAHCRLAAQNEAEKAIELEKAKYRPKFAAMGGKIPEGSPPQNKPGASPFSMMNPLSLFGSGKPRAPESDKLAVLELEWYDRVATIIGTWKRNAEETSETFIKPLKRNIQVIELGLAWVPFWEIRTAEGLKKVPAYR